jgi:hypothetical protein
MGVQAMYPVAAEKWYDEDEAQAKLDRAVAQIGDYLEAGEWAVVGFPYGIGAHYTLKVYSGRDAWDFTLRGLNVDEGQKAAVHKWDGSQEGARKAMVDTGSKFCVSLVGSGR